MSCACDTLQDYYYALVIDKGEAPGIICPGDPACIDDSLKRYAPEDRNTGWAIQLSILVPLFLMGTVMPCILYSKDKKEKGKWEPPLGSS